ncbi:uncharacterized protein LOC118183929 [Stegodyphus dumicola]|uniref:uncharacterized protein LOC118183929 n=1 Tax=Stegodyphus dumicola TaxID=202533 RepID=UPI0015A98CF1|nr:uncharacterized protein LOC118183929 [Stegodyphus dumicola]
MGDADSQPLIQRRQDAEDMNALLDIVEENLNHLHQAIHDMEQRIIRTFDFQAKCYVDFRKFFLAMNVLLILLFVATVTCYSLEELIMNNETQEFLNATVVLLLNMLGGIAVPLYLSALWSIYAFNIPCDVFLDDFSSDLDDINEDAPNSDVSREDSSTIESRDSLILSDVLDDGELSETGRNFTPEVNLLQCKQSQDLLSYYI